MNTYDSIECPNCGNIVPMGKFCIYCGEDVSKNIQKNFYEVVCPECESITPRGDYCLYCGSDISKQPIYIRASDSLSRDYKEKTFSITDINLLLDKIFKMDRFSIKNIIVTFKDLTEKVFLESEISLSQIKTLDILNVKQIKFIVFYDGLFVGNLISIDLNRRCFTIFYTCEEVLFLLKEFLT